MLALLKTQVVNIFFSWLFNCLVLLFKVLGFILFGDLADGRLLICLVGQ